MDLEVEAELHPQLHSSICIAAMQYFDFAGYKPIPRFGFTL